MKPRTAKTKGAQTEQMFCDWLKTYWNLPHIERRHLAGANDRGDIAGWPGVCVLIREVGE